MVRRTPIAIALFIVMMYMTWGLSKTVPSSLIPDEDQGTLMAMVQLGDGLSLNHTEAAVKKLNAIYDKDKLIVNDVSFVGYNFLAGALQSNYGFSFVNLSPWDERRAPDQRSDAVARKLMGQVWGIPEAQIFVFNPPPIMGMSTTGGFEVYLQYRGEGSPGGAEERTEPVDGAGF